MHHRVKRTCCHQSLATNSWRRLKKYLTQQPALTDYNFTIQSRGVADLGEAASRRLLEACGSLQESWGCQIGMLRATQGAWRAFGLVFSSTRTCKGGSFFKLAFWCGCRRSWKPRTQACWGVRSKGPSRMTNPSNQGIFCEGLTAPTVWAGVPTRHSMALRSRSGRRPGGID